MGPLQMLTFFSKIISSKNILTVLVFLITGAGMSGCKKDMVPNKPQVEKRWMVTTIAGDGVASFANGLAANAEFHFPDDVAVASDGALFVTDGDNRRIRKISGGQVTPFAGGDFGFANGVGSSAQFKFPTSLTIDRQGNIFSADARDPRIRKITSAANVTTYAGAEEEGFADGTADSARFRGENRIATDEEGNVFIADAQNNRIRKISVSGIVTTLAGSDTAGFKDGKGKTAQFNFPCGIAVDKLGNVFVSDGSNFCIRKITPEGWVTTIAGKKQQGNLDGVSDVALFEFPTDMVVDGQDNVYVLDLSRIRKISPQGTVSTIAGSIDGFQDGEGASAKFFTPDGLGIDAQGNIYVADTNNNRIRKISFE
jgi:sugar lactone lactonase YvrE